MENQELINAIQQFIKALVAPIVKEEVEKALADALKNTHVFQDRVNVLVDNALEDKLDDALEGKVRSEVEDAIDNYDFRDAVDSAIDNYDFDEVLGNHDFSEQIKEAVAEELERLPYVRTEIGKVLREMADAITIGPKIV